MNKLYIIHLNWILFIKSWYIKKLYNIILKIKWRLKIWKITYLFIIMLSLYKSCDWIFFSTKWSLKLYSVTKLIILIIILSFGQNLYKIWKIKNDVYVLFSMKWINRMQIFFCHNKWGSLVVKELISIFEVQGPIPTHDMGCG